MKVRCWALKPRQTQPGSLRAALAIRALCLSDSLFSLKAHFCSLFLLCPLPLCCRAALQEFLTNPHIPALKYAGWCVTSAQPWLLYLTFPVCARPGPGHQHKPPQQLPPRLQQQQTESTFKQQKNTNNANSQSSPWAFDRWGIRCHSSLQGLHIPRERGRFPPSTTRFKRSFLATSLTIRFSELKWNQSTRQSVGWGWPQPMIPTQHSTYCPLLRSPPAPPPHSFIFGSKDLSEMYKHKKFLMSYPQPSSAGNEVIHAVHILIYHQQKTSQDRGKSQCAAKTSI